jgi:hypothetical protein
VLDHEKATDSCPEELLADPGTSRSQTDEPEGERLRPRDRRPLQQSGGGERGDESLRPFDRDTESDREVAELPEPVATVHQLQQGVQRAVRIGDDHSVGGIEPELEVVVIAAQQGQMGLEPETVAGVQRRSVEGLHGNQCVTATAAMEHYPQDDPCWHNRAGERLG